MVAAWRRGGAVDNIVVPTLLSISAFPAFFTSLVAVYVLGLKLGWFPLGHAYSTDLEPGFNYTFLESAFRHAQLPILIIMLAFAGGWVLNMRTVMINTIEEDYVSMALAKGLSDRRVMTALRRPERDPAAAERLRRAVRDRGRRPHLHRVRLQLPRRRPDARAGGARQRLPADAGAAAGLRGLRDRRELHHGPAQPRPRPARASELTMSQMQPVAADEGLPRRDRPARRCRCRRERGAGGSGCRSGCGSCSRTRSRASA